MTGTFDIAAAYRLLEQAADAGLPCPTNERIGEASGHADGRRGQRVLAELTAQGSIKIENFSRTTRRITILATGRTTGKTDHNAKRFSPAGKPTIQTEAMRAPRVERDPCGFCGVRRDYGCHHYPRVAA